MRIICDTNVWYKLGTGEIQRDQFENNTLVCPGQVLIELATSANLFKRPELIKGAFSAIVTHANELIPLNSLEHMLCLLLPHYNGNLKQIMLIYCDMRKFLSIDFDAISVENIVETRKEIAIWINAYKEATDRVNQIVESIHHNTDLQTFNHKGVHDTTLAKLLLVKVLNKYKSNIVEEDKEDLITTRRWQELDFVTNLWGAYLNKVERTKGQKFQRNDWNDLFIPAYVQPNVKYATTEKKWLKLIRASPQLKEYLFELKAPPETVAIKNKV